ncbi:MAG: hypothetical protein ACKKL4_00070 [Patescibacteria group bacterium]
MHIPYEGQGSGQIVPMQYIREFLCGPDIDCWQACLQYSLREAKRREIREAIRALTMTAYAHARYHFNIPQKSIDVILASGVMEICNRIGELLSYHPTDCFCEIELILLHHEPYLPCYDPRGDWEEMWEYSNRFDPDID